MKIKETDPQTLFIVEGLKNIEYVLLTDAGDFTSPIFDVLDSLELNTKIIDKESRIKIKQELMHKIGSMLSFVRYLSFIEDKFDISDETIPDWLKLNGEFVETLEEHKRVIFPKLNSLVDSLRDMELDTDNKCMDTLIYRFLRVYVILQFLKLQTEAHVISTIIREVLDRDV